MEVTKLEVPKMAKENIIEMLSELKHCAYTYIENEKDEENIKSYTALGVAILLIEKSEKNVLSKITDEFVDDVKKSNAEVFKK